MDKIYDKFKFLKVIDDRDEFYKGRLNLPPKILLCPRSHYASESGKWIAIYLKKYKKICFSLSQGLKEFLEH